MAREKREKKEAPPPAKPKFWPLFQAWNKKMAAKAAAEAKAKLKVVVVKVANNQGSMIVDQGLKVKI